MKKENIAAISAVLISFLTLLVFLYQTNLIFKIKYRSIYEEEWEITNKSYVPKEL